jgi:hypothetical protein
MGCIFLDDFQNLETHSWQGHSDAFASLLAQFHEKAGDLFNKSQGISIYLMISVQGRFWKGNSEGNQGFRYLASSEKLMQHWRRNEFYLPDFDSDEDIWALTRKLLALYEHAGFKLSVQLVARLEDTTLIRQYLEKEALVPRTIIETVLGIVGNEIQPGMSWL